MTKWIWVPFAVFFGAYSAVAQSHDGEPRAELYFAAGVPQGELDRTFDGSAFGGGIFIGGAVPGWPLVLGTDLAVMNYGSEMHLSIHDTVFDEGIDEDLAVPLEALSTHASNNIALGHFVVRLEPLTGAFRPYVDVLAGVKYFATRMRVDSDIVIFRRGISHDAWETDLAFSYGIGGGFELALHEFRSEWRTGPTTVSLHAGARYLFGTDADVALDNTLHQLGDRIAVDVVESRTDLLVPMFGLRVRH